MDAAFLIAGDGIPSRDPAAWTCVMAPTWRGGWAIRLPEAEADLLTP
jgi:hypothetical protein